MNVRLILLLQSLTQRSFKSPPKGVGLKTMIQARTAGLIVLEQTVDGHWVARLTDKGRALQAKLTCTR